MKSLQKFLPHLGTLLVIIVMFRFGNRMAGGTVETPNIVLGGLFVGGIAGYVGGIAMLAGARKLFWRALIGPVVFLLGSVFLASESFALIFGRALMMGFVLGCIGAIAHSMMPMPPEGPKQREGGVRKGLRSLEDIAGEAGDHGDHDDEDV
jgi:Na+/melibiose symporter-like transporter